jgi:hypothetical protein
MHSGRELHRILHRSREKGRLPESKLGMIRLPLGVLKAKRAAMKGRPLRSWLLAKR